MVSSVEHKHNNLFDNLLWGLVAVLLLSGIGGYYILSTQSLFLRVVGLLAVLAIAITLAARTAAGKKAWDYWQQAIVELRKVVWPNKKEIIQSTLAVLAMVVVMGLLLWAIDAILIRVVAWLLS